MFLFYRVTELVTALKAENEKLKKPLTQKTNELHQNQTYSINRVLEIQLLKKEVKEAKKRITVSEYPNKYDNVSLLYWDQLKDLELGSKRKWGLKSLKSLISFVNTRQTTHMFQKIKILATAPTLRQLQYQEC